MINILYVDFNLKINRKKYFYNLKCKVFSVTYIFLQSSSSFNIISYSKRERQA